MTGPGRWVSRFLREERGAISVWSLFLFITAGIIGAAALDVTNFFATRTQLQVTADIAAHAALWRRNAGRSADQARTDAISVAQYGMPLVIDGRVVQDADITFGSYDPATDTFTTSNSSKGAVLVRADRDAAGGNPVGTFLFRLAGLDQVDIGASAVAMTYQPGCLTEGFSAEDVVDLLSNSNFLRDFCMHSNSHVKLGNGNFFDSGTIVSMPSLDDLQIGSSGFDQNPGLEEALRENEYDLRILDRVRATSTDPLDAAPLSTTDDDRPSYIAAGSLVVPLGTGGNITYTNMTQFAEGRVHTRWCNRSNNRMELTGPSSGMTYQNIVIVTDCQVKLSGKINLHNVVIFTRNTGNDSVWADTGGGGGGSSDGLWIGRDDDCAPGGAAQIITRGGFRNSAALYLSGAQILALGPVQFASNATGEGASIVSGSTISGNSNLNFSGCGTGMEESFKATYVRLAR